MWDPKFHCPIHKTPLPVPILSHINPVQAYPSHFLNIHFFILSSHLRLGLPSVLFPSGFPIKTLCAPLLSSIRATCPVHPILVFITPTLFRDKYGSRRCFLCSRLQSLITSTSQAQMSSSAQYSQTSQNKQQAKLQLLLMIITTVNCLSQVLTCSDSSAATVPMQERYRLLRNLIKLYISVRTELERREAPPPPPPPPRPLLFAN